MKNTPRRSGGQSAPVENARPALPYRQIPDCLFVLPTGERAAAQEVWTALFQDLRLGSTPRRITDEELMSCPVLIERSAEHARKGLEILERLGLISREAKGSSRRVAIVAKLRGAREVAQAQNTAKTPTIKPGLRVARDEPIGPDELELLKAFFPKRCAGLVVSSD